MAKQSCLHLQVMQVACDWLHERTASQDRPRARLYVLPERCSAACMQHRAYCTTEQWTCAVDCLLIRHKVLQQRPRHCTIPVAGLGP